MAMNKWKGKVAIVTGASAGIGAAIAEKLVKEGLQVVGLARHNDLIEEAAKKLEHHKGKLYSLQVDITKEENILEAFKWVTENLGPVHVLINNAGIIAQTNLTNGDLQSWRKVLETNVLGLCITTREAVKIMRANNIDGHIIHINSISGHYVTLIPQVNMYPASKYAVTALTETLRQEINHLGLKIKITSVSPGAVNTKAVENGSDLDPEIWKILKESKFLQTGDIVDAVCYVLSTPPHVQVHELIIKPVGETF